MNTNNDIKIGFIGAGNMGRSIIEGLVSKKAPLRILVHDKHPERLNDLEKSGKITLVASNLELCNQCDIVVIAVKPQGMKDTLGECLAFEHSRKPLFISVAAGITTSQIQNGLGLGPSYPLVRAMPNTPAMVGLGATGLYGVNLNQELKEVTEEIVGAIGRWVWVENEQQMDIVTALSGSGPAYFFYFCEQLIEAATNLGLSEEVATELAIDTGLGAMTMAKQLDLNLSALRKQVTSPGGTTEAGLNELIASNLKQTAHRVLNCAVQRGQTLSKQLEES